MRLSVDYRHQLEGHALTIGYPDRVVGSGLDVGLETGEVLALLGPNGGGKTTLLKTLLGLLRAQSGTVRVFGLDPVADPVFELDALIAEITNIIFNVDVPGIQVFVPDTGPLVLPEVKGHGGIVSIAPIKRKVIKCQFVAQVDDFGGLSVKANIDLYLIRAGIRKSLEFNLP